MNTNQSRVSRERNNSKDYSIKLNELPSLQELASHKIASTIRRNNYDYCARRVYHFFFYGYADWYTYSKEVKSLNLPGPIETMIKTSVQKISRELTAWMNNFDEVRFTQFALNDWPARCDMDKFFYKMFAVDKSICAKEKKRFVISMLAFPHVFCYNFYKTAEIIEKFKFVGEELKNIKCMFAYSVGEFLKAPPNWEDKRIIDETYFREIMNWCLGDDVMAISKFKKEVSHNIIFNLVFYHITKSYDSKGLFKVGHILGLLEVYLKWYLMSDDQVKIYKLNRLSDFSNQLEIFMMVSERRDEKFLEILLKWFFDGDDVKMRRFELDNFNFKEANKKVTRR